MARKSRAKITYDPIVARFRKGGKFIKKSLGLKSSQARKQYNEAQATKLKIRKVTRPGKIEKIKPQTTRKYVSGFSTQTLKRDDQYHKGKTIGDAVNKLKKYAFINENKLVYDEESDLEKRRRKIVVGVIIYHPDEGSSFLEIEMRRKRRNYKTYGAIPYHEIIQENILPNFSRPDYKLNRVVYIRPKK
jgi:hypothetical protein